MDFFPKNISENQIISNIKYWFNKKNPTIIPGTKQTEKKTQFSADEEGILQAFLKIEPGLGHVPFSIFGRALVSVSSLHGLWIR